MVVCKRLATLSLSIAWLASMTMSGAQAAVPETRAAVIAAARAAGTDPMAAIAALRPGMAAQAVPTDTRAPRSNPSTATGGGDIRRIVNEGFEQIDRIIGNNRFAPGGIYRNGWIRQNNSDHPWLTWRQGLNDYFQASDGAGDSYAASHPFSTLADAGTLSSWLVSPPINFAPDTRVSFFTRTLAGEWPTRLQVRACVASDCSDVGTQPEDVGQFGLLLHDINPGELDAVYPLEWTQITLTAADGLPTAGSGRIAFRHFVHQTDGVLRGGWTGIDRVVVEQGEGESGELDLSVTVSPADPASPNACGSETTLEIAAGDQVNLCYRVQNNSTQTLRYHSLRDDHVGALLTEQSIALAPGTSHQYNRLLVVSESISPSATWSAQADPTGYVRDSSQPAQWIDITDGEPIAAPLAFPADFDFRLFGDRIDTLCVNFGVLASRRDFYGNCPTTASFGLLPLPDVQLGPYSNAIALYQTGIGGGGGKFQKIVGSAPDRRYIVEYYQSPVEGGSSDPQYGLTAQAILHERTHVIEFQYGNRVFGGTPAAAYGGWASIGLQNKNLALPFSFRTQSLRDVDRIVWTPSDPTVLTRTRQVHIVAKAPSLDIGTDAIEASAEAGAAVSIVRPLGNSGSGRLDWAAGTAHARSHLPSQPRVVVPLHETNTATPFVARDGVANSAPSGVAPALQLAPVRAEGVPTDASLWAFDIMWGYLVSTDPQAPSYDSGTTLHGLVGARLITGADFLDDDFSRIYAFDATSNELLRYQSLGSANAVEQVIGTAQLTPGVTPGGLKQDPTTGALYLTTADGAVSQLWTIDPATAAVRPIGTITGAPGIISIDFDNDGRLYGLDIVLDALIAIDKHTAEAAPIGSLGFSTQGSISSLAFDPRDDDTLYLASFHFQSAAQREDGSLWSVDKTTGQARFIAPVIGPDNSWSQFGAMAFAQPGNRCVALSDVPWLSLSQTEGSLAPGAPAVPLELSFDAIGLTPGRYSADLCIHSNDPLRRRIALPLRFTVEGDTGVPIFADGFEAGAP